MRYRLLGLAGLCCLLPAQPSEPIEKGSFTLHMMLHAMPVTSGWRRAQF